MNTKLTKLELEASVKNLGEIYRVSTPFNHSLKLLIESGIKAPISERDLVFARIQKGKDNSLSKYGNYTRAGFLYLRDKPYLLALNSPLLDLELADLTFVVSRKERYPSTSKDVYYKYMQIAEIEKNKKPENRSVLIFSERKNYEIPTNRFDEDELTRFLFKDQSKNYGDFLMGNKTKGINKISVNKIPVWLINEFDVDSRKETILTQLWLHGLNGRYGIDGAGILAATGYVRCLKKTGEVS